MARKVITRRSSAVFKQAKDVMVGGVNSPVRSFRGVGGDPIVVDHGKGQHFFDIDGNRYTDYCLSWGALILGHGQRDVVKAVKEGIAHGTSFGTTTEPEVTIARFITKCVDSVDQIRFVNSGTEATMSAIRLARGFTKRNLIVKFDGCYHGHFDDLLATAGSGVATLPSSSSAGIPARHIEHTLSLEFNNLIQLEETLSRHKDDIACVIVEAVPGNMGVVMPEKQFVKALRTLTRKYGIVLIYDEVMTGFRTQLGGAQKEFGVTPDLTCFGKIIGGGFPVGAYGGRKDIMAHLAPLGNVYQAGTFSGNPIVIRAGLATLENLSASRYQTLNKRAAAFTERVNRVFLDEDIPAHLSAYHSMISLRFRKEAVRNYHDAQVASSADIYPKLFRYLMQQGIYLPPADLEAFFLSTAHTVTDLEYLGDKLVQFFKDFR